MKKKFEKFAVYWLPAILWMTVIFIFSAYPTVKTSEVLWKEFVIKKSVHVFEYGILALLIFRAIRNTTKTDPKKAGLISIFTSTFYGMTDEYHQSYTSGREPTVRDVLFDFFGSILTMFITTKYLFKTRFKFINRLFEIFEIR